MSVFHTIQNKLTWVRQKKFKLKNKEIFLSFVEATNGRPLLLIGNFIRRLPAAQTFFGKSLTKNFFELHLGRGLPPPHPRFAHSSDQRLCLWKPQAFEKAWPKLLFLVIELTLDKANTKNRRRQLAAKILTKTFNFDCRTHVILNYNYI